MFKKKSFNVLAMICFWVLIVFGFVYQNMSNAYYQALPISEQISMPAPITMFIEYKIGMGILLFITILQTIVTLGEFKNTNHQTKI